MRDAAPQADTCGLCDQPLDGDHSHAQVASGTCVEYEVVEVRGVLADSVAVHEPADTHRLPAWVLSTNLGVDAGSLLGVRYTCLVARDSYGTTRSDYRLRSSGSLQPKARPGG
ncbi:hypothetical protein [Streptomyces griseosporeus]|uniref:hypothetical protein n=1 Tax=Streptomyces griseosporeus TaxID=1910 RepID=UPI0036FCB7DD